MSLNADRIMTPNLPDIFPVLHSDRLDFTQMRAIHASDILYIYGEKKLAEFENIKILINEQEALEFIDRFQIRFNEKKGIRWAISKKGEKQVIGTIGFKGYIPLHKAFVGYEIHPDFGGKGYATEALATAVKYAFDSLDLQRIEAEVMPGNLASEKVLAKNGFNREGQLKRSMYWDGKYFDINLFALLQSDYRNH